MNAIDISRLINGFGRFRARQYEQDPSAFEQLASQGQSPKVMMIACCDSRVDPAIITDSAPGEIFVIRNVANLVPPCEFDGHYHGTSAALEFGVCSLEVEHIIVFGHAKCGGIRTLMEGVKGGQGPGEFVSPWMAIAAEARQQTLEMCAGESIDTQSRACEQAAILISLKNLMTFPWIQQRVEQGVLQLHGWYFDIEQGELLGYNPVLACFEVKN